MGSATALEWYFDNEGADLSGNVATCFLNLRLQYSATIAASDIDSWTVTSPIGWHWNIPAANSYLGTSSDGTPYITAGMWYGANVHAFPLAGAWTAELRLKNGQTSSLQTVFSEPNSSADATHPYLYTADDWTPSADGSQYAKALARFPSSGCTFAYSAASGKITSSGFATARSSYLASEPRGYNLYCWLFDGNNNYLGYTLAAYTLREHSSTGFLTPEGEISIAQGTASGPAGTVDLSQVKSVRIVSIDGGQFPLTGELHYRYRSISNAVPVFGLITPQP